MIGNILDRELLFLYVVTTARVFFSFLVFLAFVQHSPVVSLFDGVRGRQGGRGEGHILAQSMGWI